MNHIEPKVFCCHSCRQDPEINRDPACGGCVYQIKCKTCNYDISGDYSFLASVNAWNRFQSNNSCFYLKKYD